MNLRGHITGASEVVGVGREKDERGPRGVDRSFPLFRGSPPRKDLRSRVRREGSAGGAWWWWGVENDGNGVGVGEEDGRFGFGLYKPRSETKENA